MATGTLAHVSAGGVMPSAWGLAALSAAAAVIAGLFLGRRLSAMPIIGLVVAGQTAAHACLSAMAGHSGTALEATASNPWVIAPLSNQTPGLIAPAWLTHACLDAASHPAMAMAHLIAAVAVGLWLAAGEDALWKLIRFAAQGFFTIMIRLADGIVSLPSITVPPRLRGRRRFSWSHLRLHLNVWSRGPARRGPPALVPTA